MMQDALHGYFITLYFKVPLCFAYKLLYGSVIGRSALGLRRPPWPVQLQGDQRVFCVIKYFLN
eukprot:scaffold55246_cov51-Phaeocystis_antarctica.AAC.2